MTARLPKRACYFFGLDKLQNRKHCRAVWGILFITSLSIISCAGRQVIKQEKIQKVVYSVAVLPFKNTTGDKSIDYLQEGIAESVTGEIAKNEKFRVVERNQLDKVLSELKFHQLGLIEPQTVIELGKILGVQYVVVGNFQKIGEEFKLNGRFVETQTGNICGAESVTGIKSTLFEIQDRLSQKLINGFKPLKSQ